MGKCTLNISVRVYTRGYSWVEEPQLQATQRLKRKLQRGTQLSRDPSGITDLSRAKVRSLWQRLMLLFHSGSQREASGTGEN